MTLIHSLYLVHPSITYTHTHTHTHTHVRIYNSTSSFTLSIRTPLPQPSLASLFSTPPALLTTPPPPSSSSSSSSLVYYRHVPHCALSLFSIVLACVDSIYRRYIKPRHGCIKALSGATSSAKYTYVSRPSRRPYHPRYNHREESDSLSV